eukprot:291970-Pelagomonas_calceolata.AAC.1
MAAHLLSCPHPAACTHTHAMSHGIEKNRTEKKNYVGSETLPTSIEEKGPHWCTDRMTHPP